MDGRIRDGVVSRSPPELPRSGLGHEEPLGPTPLEDPGGWMRWMRLEHAHTYTHIVGAQETEACMSSKGI